MCEIVRSMIYNKGTVSGEAEIEDKDLSFLNCPGKPGKFFNLGAS